MTAEEAMAGAFAGIQADGIKIGRLTNVEAGRAILAALSAAGFVVVRREPTRDMQEAGWLSTDTGVHMADIWRAMIAAALRGAG